MSNTEQLAKILILPIYLTGQSGNKDIGMQIDFRRVYTDILNDWFGTVRATTDTLLFHDFPTVSLFSDTVETVASGNWRDSNVWTVGRVPFANEYVKVNAGHTMTVDKTIMVKNIRLEGKLLFTGPYSIQMTG